MSEQGATSSVHVGEWVCNFACLGKLLWHNVIGGSDQLHEVVLWEILLSELELQSESGIGFTQDCVTVSGYHFAAVESVPHVVGNFLAVPILTMLFFNL